MIKYKVNLEEIDGNIDLNRTPAIAELLAYGILRKVQPKPFPQHGDKYFYVSSAGKIKQDAFDSGSEGHMFRRDSKNTFKTQKEAEDHRVLLSF